MDPFELPDDLPAEVDALTALRDQAQAAITEIQGRFDTDADLSDDDVAYLGSLVDAVDQLNSAIAEATLTTDDDAAAHQAAVAEVMARAAAATASVETDDVDETEEVVEGEVVEARELVTAGAGSGGGRPGTALAKKNTKRAVNLRGLGTDEAPKDAEPGWVVVAGAPGFRPEEIGQKTGFARMGKALDSVTKGHGVGKLSGRLSGLKMRQPVGQITRDLVEATDQHALVAAINKATDQRNLPGGSLIAAGGWCAPSEQIYTFCDVNDAVDLISVPEIAINRGGLRWPVEPDLTSLFESFEFFFTEPELEAVDADGNPTAFKHCVEIPCPDEFEEMRLNAVGWCVTAGILQRQGWPESIEYVLRSLTQEHLRAMSRRTILDMVHGSTLKTIDNATTIGAAGSVLNSLALMATNVRIRRSLSRSALIEGVAPSWFFEVLRADLAYRDGVENFNVTDNQITSWLTARNISLQFVGDWQTRDVGLPGHLDTLRWPGHVDIMLYEPGTWFRALSNIIEVGVMYPKEQLQINRYTEFFTEDAIAIGKRCGLSLIARIPLRVDGGIGARVTLSYSDTTTDSGGAYDPTPLPSGQEGMPVTVNLKINGAPTTASFKLSLDGEKTAVFLTQASTPADVEAALVALNDGMGEDAFAVGGTAGNWTVKYPGGDLAVTDTTFTGGTAPSVTIT